MRTLGIDYGESRVGLALSDELGVLAQPAGHVEAKPREACLAQLKALVAEKEVGLVVVGLPRNMDGSYGPASALVREFVAALEPVVGVPVRTWDERLTTVQAQRLLRGTGRRVGRDKGRVDAAAAAVLLQSYLDAQ